MTIVLSSGILLRSNATSAADALGTTTLSAACCANACTRAMPRRARLRGLNRLQKPHISTKPRRAAATVFRNERES